MAVTMSMRMAVHMSMGMVLRVMLWMILGMHIMMLRQVLRMLIVIHRMITGVLWVVPVIGFTLHRHLHTDTIRVVMAVPPIGMGEPPIKPTIVVINNTSAVAIADGISMMVGRR